MAGHDYSIGFTKTFKYSNKNNNRNSSKKNCETEVVEIFIVLEQIGDRGKRGGGIMDFAFIGGGTMPAQLLFSPPSHGLKVIYMKVLMFTAPQTFMLCCVRWPDMAVIIIRFYIGLIFANIILLRIMI